MQEQFHISKVYKETLWALKKGYKLIVHQGGEYSGKTFGILAAIKTYLHENDKSLYCDVIGQSSTELDGGAYKDWETIHDLIGHSFLKNKTTKLWGVGKSTIKFRSVDKIGKAKSGKNDLRFLNEANHIPWDIADFLIRKSAIRIIDYNPSGRFWFHKHILPKIDVYKPYMIKRSTYLDNPSISDEKVREIESMKSDPWKWAVYGMGELGINPGVVLTDWSTFLGDLPIGKNRAYFLDWGFSNDVTSLGEAVVVGDTIYCKLHIYETGLLTKHINDKMDALGIQKHTPIYADNIPKENAELAQYGWIIIPTKKFPGSVNYGLGILKQYKIFIHVGSGRAIEEVENYVYLKKDGEFTNDPVDKDNHFIDGLRYYAMANASQFVKHVSKRYYSERII